MHGFAAVLGLLLLSRACLASLLPIGIEDDDQNHDFLPNERDSLNDCHLRYYRFGLTGLVKPAYGRPAYLREFAHMAAIGWSQTDGSITWSCGGSLITEWWVLTAAHCTADDRNVAPDVARFGDINIHSDVDDQYAQQRQIAEIIRHPEHRFSARYHDIALVRLDTNITLHDTVAPACLWVDDEIRFPSMEATGWGNTGYNEEATPILLKVSLSPVEKEVCDEHYSAGQRGLRRGLQSHQLCAGDIKMDTCPGDSGGPLQIKLLHNTKMTPFVVAVTSFGSACGQSTPGVYTRVAPYRQWIETVLRERNDTDIDLRFEPYACALRYVHLREYEDDVIRSKGTKQETIDADNAHMSLKSSAHQVRIQWDNGADGRDNCSGIIIDEFTVVTLAKCTAHRGAPATHVLYQGDKRNDIIRRIRHPRYRENSLYNNIALLLLANRFEFTKSFYPACILHSYKPTSPELEVSGEGRRDLNFFHAEGVITEFEPQLVDLLPRATIQPAESCSYPEEFRSALTMGLQDEHLCFGNRLFLVPTACEQNYGGPVQRYIHLGDRYFKFVYGLNLFGRDCGFGESAVATRLASHVEWMKSVLLPNQESGGVLFFNSDLNEGDECSHVDGSAGRCTEVHRCPKIRQDIRSKKRVSFCSSGSLVCCPAPFVLSNVTSQSAKELDECEERYARLYGEYDLDEADGPPSLVLLGVPSSDGDDYTCTGSLITTSVVITTASCVQQRDAPPHRVMLDPYGQRSPRIPIEQIIVHPEYNKDTQKNDIAVIKLQQSIELTANVFPGCIWQNVTHTPLRLDMAYGQQSSFSFVSANPMYNSDCEGTLNTTVGLAPTQLCLTMKDAQGCYYHGDPVYWIDLNDVVVRSQYIVGLMSVERCNEHKITVFTRLAMFVNWIKSVL